VCQRCSHEEYVPITLWLGGRRSVGLSLGTSIHLLMRFLLHRWAKCLAKSTSVYVSLCGGRGGGGCFSFEILSQMTHFESDDTF